MVDQVTSSVSRTATGLHSLQSLGWGAVAMQQLNQLINWSGQSSFQGAPVSPWVALISEDRPSAPTTNQSAVLPVPAPAEQGPDQPREQPAQANQDAASAVVATDSESDKKALEQAAREQAARELALKEQAEKEQAEKAQAERLRAEKEQAETLERTVREAAERADEERRLQAKVDDERRLAEEAALASAAAQAKLNQEKADSERIAKKPTEPPQATVEQTPAEKPTQDRQVESTAAPQPIAEKPAVEKPVTSKSTTEQPEAERQTHNRQSIPLPNLPKTAERKPVADRPTLATTPATVVPGSVTVDRPLVATLQRPVSVDQTVEGYLAKLEQLVLQLNMELGRRDAASSDPIQDLSQRVIDLNLENLALKEQLKASMGNRHE